ncbi:MAG: hypothetical protein LDL44_03180 [Caenispirillum sp.]|nr:hypothetical protein [Caenispirillum sp.]
MTPDALLRWGLWLCLHHQDAGEPVTPVDVLDRWHAEQPGEVELVDGIIWITHRTTVASHIRAEWPVPRIRFGQGMEPVLEIRDRASGEILVSARGDELGTIGLALLAADDPPASPVEVAVVEPRTSDLGRPDQEDWRERISQLPPPPPRGQLSLF